MEFNCDERSDSMMESKILHCVQNDKYATLETNILNETTDL